MAKAKKPNRKKRYREYDAETLMQERQYGFFWYDWIWRVIRPLLIGALSLIMISGMLLSGWNYINSKYLLPVDPTDSTPVVFEIESGSSLTTISRQLEEQGLIRNKTVFKYMVDFQGLSGRIKAGAYNLSRDMTLSEIINELSSSSAPTERTITLIEGWTCEDIAEYLVRQGALTDTEEFLKLCSDTETFSAYYVVNELTSLVPEDQLSQRRYALEGYLSPDTYNIYLNESAENIIKRLLNQSEKVIWDIYDQREQKKSMLLDPNDPDATTDDVDLPGVDLNQDELYILASIIEKEAKPDDFAKVSAVFHNRLAEGMRLESCATVQYVLGTTRLALTDSDTSVDSPYNTYKNSGLPIGPICNPSRAALQAAAFPDEEYLNEGYLYFCSKDPTSGELQFSKTYEEHQAAVEQYRPLWIEYDNSRAGSDQAGQEGQ
ncbi:MAG TPA: endolytic transglycosylase MltG [Candidatus Fimadaptatus faecigallinarum]|uniref:Endolytic murein transglycosylase n=1 Tax=Candidatus Fimadaptatus faecigallinarum TaxID=2840814 RepID=A0A9D1S497_9FIRM|nr:endolytic transglycosylase MltG [Candidatus Fimadaptatus faecigallinarum]